MRCPVWMLVVLFLCRAPAGGEEPACLRLNFDPHPSWAISGAWGADGSELLLADILRGSLVAYGIPGGQGEEVGELSRPTVILARSEGYLVKEPPGRFVFLDHELEQTGSIDYQEVEPAKDRDGTRVANILELAVRGSEVVALATLRAPGGVQGAFIKYRLEPEPGFERLRAADIVTGREELFYRLTGPAIAYAGESAYALRFRDRAYLEGVTGDPRRLDAFPTGFGELPSLPEPRGAANAAEMFGAVERSILPVQLYGREEFLYLLTRRPKEPGHTLWELHQIDPVEDRLIRTLTLPTTAHHLFLVPGAERWALVEKGPVIGPGEQDIQRAVLVPSGWIEDRESSELTEANLPECAAYQTKPR